MYILQTPCVSTCWVEYVLLKTCLAKYSTNTNSTFFRFSLAEYNSRQVLKMYTMCYCQFYIVSPLCNASNQFFLFYRISLSSCFYFKMAMEVYFCEQNESKCTATIKHTLFITETPNKQQINSEVNSFYRSLTNWSTFYSCSQRLLIDM